MLEDLQVLTTCRNSCILVTSLYDVVDEAGEWWNAADEERKNGTPVTGVSGRIAVYAVEVVHVWD